MHKAILIRVVLFVCLMAAFSGCASERAVLVNSRGEELTCETSGSGFFGAISVRNQQEKCVSDAEKRGYHLKEQKD
jgi:hypothetical protein